MRRFALAVLFAICALCAEFAVAPLAPAQAATMRMISAPDCRDMVYNSANHIFYITRASSVLRYDVSKKNSWRLYILADHCWE